MNILGYLGSMFICGLLMTSLSSPTWAQQVFEGTHPVPPLYPGQTRAPLCTQKPEV